MRSCSFIWTAQRRKYGADLVCFSDIWYIHEHFNSYCRSNDLFGCILWNIWNGRCCNLWQNWQTSDHPIHIICLSDLDCSRFDGLLAFYIFLRKESHFRKRHYGSLPNGTEYYSRQYYLSISDRKCTADHFSRMYMWAGTLVLGDSVSGMAKIVSQINTLIQLLMTYISKLIPLFVFISMMNLFLSGNLKNISSLIKQIILVILITSIILIFYISMVCWKCRVKPGVLIKKLLPTFLIALSTASSSAAFGTNIESCKALGIDKKLINFGVSIGQIIFMPSGAIQFFIISLCTGQSFGTEITIVWIITSIITSTILAIATPPIPGGGLSCYTILFAQLGIPSAGIALVISIDLLMDAFLTACNLAFLQTELVLSAKKLNLLDEEKLRK